MSGAGRDGRVLALLGIVLLSLGMRSATTSFAPLYARISDDVVLGAVVLGTVGALAPIVVLLVVATLPLLAVPVIARPGRVDDPRPDA